MVIDEAGFATEPDLIQPITCGARRVTLIGDSKQLGPVVTSRRAQEAGLDVSLFDRLSRCGSPEVFLDIQYRMHPAIAAFPSRHFYDGALLSAPETAQRLRPDVTFPWPDPTSPLCFIHVRPRGGEGRGGLSGTSSYNDEEAELVASCVSRLLASGAAPTRFITQTAASVSHSMKSAAG